MTRVGLLYVDEGDGCANAEIVGVAEGVGAVDTSDETDVDLTPAQVEAAQDAYERFVVRHSAAVVALKAAQAEIASAKETYKADTAWLVPLHQAGVIRDEEAQAAEYRAQADQRNAEHDARMAAEDAQLGERLFVQVDITGAWKRHGWGKPQTFKIHRRECRNVRGIPSHDYSHLRMDPACELYIKGAQVCGVCKPDDLMAADTANGEKVTEVRRRRESVPVSLTPAALRKGVKVHDAQWKTGPFPGLTIMAGDSFPDVPKHAKIVGWKDPAQSWGAQIPEDVREQVYQAACTNNGWVVAWNTQPGRTGYLVVRAKTKAEIREEREGK